MLAAFDEAIDDGVDIISASLESPSIQHFPYFKSVFDVASFYAMRKGILTSQAAGNSGPSLYTMSYHAPWLLSVAATTFDRKIVTKVQLGNGVVYEVSFV